MFEKITDGDLNKRAMTRVSSTPTRPTAFGESGMDAQELKARFDSMPRFLAKRINEILGAISSGDLADNLVVNCVDRSVLLKTLVNNLLSGNVSDIKVQTIYETLSLVELATMLLQINDSITTGELAERMVMRDGETFNDFYEKAKGFVNSDHDAIVAKVLEHFTDVSEEGL